MESIVNLNPDHFKSALKLDENAIETLIIMQNDKKPSSRTLNALAVYVGTLSLSYHLTKEIIEAYQNKLSLYQLKMSQYGETHASFEERGMMQTNKEIKEIIELLNLLGLIRKRLLTTRDITTIRNLYFMFLSVYQMIEDYQKYYMVQTEICVSLITAPNHFDVTVTEDDIEKNAILRYKYRQMLNPHNQ